MTLFHNFADATSVADVSHAKTTRDGLDVTDAAILLMDVATDGIAAILVQRSGSDGPAHGMELSASDRWVKGDTDAVDSSTAFEMDEQEFLEVWHGAKWLLDAARVVAATRGEEGTRSIGCSDRNRSRVVRMTECQRQRTTFSRVLFDSHEFRGATEVQQAAGECVEEMISSAARRSVRRELPAQWQDALEPELPELSASKEPGLAPPADVVASGALRILGGIGDPQTEPQLEAVVRRLKSDPSVRSLTLLLDAGTALAAVRARAR